MWKKATAIRKPNWLGKEGYANHAKTGETKSDIIITIKLGAYEA